jgi:hypothetical protein
MLLGGEEVSELSMANARELLMTGASATVDANR